MSYNDFRNYIYNYIKENNIEIELVNPVWERYKLENNIKENLEENILELQKLLTLKQWLKVNIPTFFSSKLPPILDNSIKFSLHNSGFPCKGGSGCRISAPRLRRRCKRPPPAGYR